MIQERFHTYGNQARCFRVLSATSMRTDHSIMSSTHRAQSLDWQSSILDSVSLIHSKFRQTSTLDIIAATSTLVLIFAEFSLTSTYSVRLEMVVIHTVCIIGLYYVNIRKLFLRSFLRLFLLHLHAKGVGAKALSFFALPPWSICNNFNGIENLCPTTRRCPYR